MGEITGGLSSRGERIGPRTAGVGVSGRFNLAVVGLSLLIAGPVLGAGIRLVASHWTPTADDAFIVSRSYDVFSTHPPLTGAHSLAGASGVPVHSPGPMLYLLLAIPVRAGAVWLLPLFMAMVNTLALAWCVSLARRRGGVAFACVTTAAILMLIRSLGPASMASIWNPTAGRMPLLLLVFLVWSVVDGEVRLLPAVVLVGSFTLQAHLSFGPPSVMLLALAVAACVLHAARLTRQGIGSGPEPGGDLGAGEPKKRWRPLLLSVLVLIALWALPAYEQLTRSPGNMRLIADSGRADLARGGADLALAAAGRAVGLPPSFSQSDDGLNASTAESFGGHTGWNTLAVALALVGLLVILAAAGRRRDRHLWSAALVALVLAVSVIATARQFPQGDVLVAFYAFKWFAIAGLMVWLVIGLAAWEALVARWPAGWRADRAPRMEQASKHPAWAQPATFGGARGLVVLAAVVGGLVLALTLPGQDGAASLYAPARQVGNAVVEGTEPGGRYLIGRSGPYDIGFTSVIGFRLRSAGRNPVTFGAVVNALGEPYRRSGQRCDGIIVLQPSHARIGRNAKILTVAEVPNADPDLARMSVLLVRQGKNSRSC